MLTDLADLTPPLVVCVAIIIAVVLFLRRQMAPKRYENTRHEDAKHGPDNPQ
jgi:MFS superfamily sulfate permease-like transporter